MTYKFTIGGKLPGLNDYTNACRTNYHKGNKMKHDAEEVVIWSVRQCLGKLHINRQVNIYYTFFEPNTKRDKDNIASFAHKVVQDALVKAGVLENDGWKHVGGFLDRFEVDNAYPRIEIELVEVVAGE